VTIVLPWEADPQSGCVSVLAPLGTALLGARIGETVTWSTGGTDRRLRIEELLYQPEAAGDFHL
jgi:regulator of nucleoside diphosphate kinase